MDHQSHIWYIDVHMIFNMNVNYPHLVAYFGSHLIQNENSLVDVFDNAFLPEIIHSLDIKLFSPLIVYIPFTTYYLKCLEYLFILFQINVSFIYGKWIKHSPTGMIYH